jgi:hypothetical protein
MGDLTTEKQNELVEKAKTGASQGSAEQVYKTLKELATSNTGSEKASGLLSTLENDPKLKDILPAVTLAYLNDTTTTGSGKSKLKLADTINVDDGLEQQEIERLAKKGTFLDEAMTKRYVQNPDKLKADAGADGVLSPKDLEAKADGVRAAQIAKVYPKEADFKTLDYNGDGKVSKDDLENIKKFGEGKLNDKNTDAKVREKIENSLPVVSYLSNNFEKLSTDKKSLSYSEATGKPSELLNAAEVMDRTMAGIDPATKKTRFDDLAVEEKIGAKKESRVSKDKIETEIAILETNLKQGKSDAASNTANLEVLKHMQKNFDAIAKANDDGGSGLSKEDFKAYRQKSELADKIQNIFPDKSKLGAGITKDKVDELASSARADKALGIDTPNLDTLEYLSKNFEDLAKRGGAAAATPGSGADNKLDSSDLAALGGDKAKLALPPEIAGTPASSDAAGKPAEVAASVKEFF